MLINNQFSDRARIHPVENFDGTFLTGWRDTGEDRLCLVITKCLGQNIAASSSPMSIIRIADFCVPVRRSKRLCRRPYSCPFELQPFYPHFALSHGDAALQERGITC